ncbi:alpha/beta hydrolase [Shimia sp. SDUM112013]|uniref:alpha/beta hydrolase n=1 Tax=Shimia sp. SDUM112013 TaxID=3136160 RepID=UPI0032EEE3D1
MKAEGDIVFGGDRLRATLFNADAPKLIVTFRQRVSPDGAFDTARPVRRFVKRNYAHLHLQSRFNDWYINSETADFEAHLGALVRPYRRIVGTGFSMGGYGILRFAEVLGLQHALLVSPQISIAPEVVPWDRRYRDCADGFDAAMGDVASRAKRGLKGVILMDPFRPLDHRHADLIQTSFPNLVICRLGCGGHPATRVLGEAGGFGRVQSQLLSGQVDVEEIRQKHRKSRRKSPTYWRHLGENAARREHMTLARIAFTRHAELAPPAK